MKKLLILFAVALFTVSVVSAGGPNIKKQVSKKSPVVKKLVPIAQEAQVIQPLQESGGLGKVESVVGMPVQPSDIRSAGEQVIKREVIQVVKAPEVKKVTVLFETQPGDAELLVNGLYVGSTPIQVPLRTGVHNVRFSLSGHSNWERQVIVYQGLRVFGILEKSK